MSIISQMGGLTNEQLTHTITDMGDSVIDGLFQRMPLLDIMRTKADIIDGGWNKVEVIGVREHGVVTNFATGREQIDLTSQDTTEQAVFGFHRFAFAVQITDKEETENSGSKALIKIAETRYNSVLGAMMRRVNRQLVVGGTDIAGIGSLNGAAGGLLEMGEDAFQIASGGAVGGLARSLTPVLRNRAKNSGGTFSLDDLYDLEIEVGLRRPEMSDNSPHHIILCSPAFLREYRSALQPQERYIKENVLDARGPARLAFGGSFITPDIELQGVNVSWEGGGAVPLSAYMLNLDGVKLCTYGSANFAFSGFIDMPGYQGRYGTVTYHGGLTANHLYSQGVLVNAHA